LLLATFAISSMVIAVPTGIKISSWIATMRGGSVSREGPNGVLGSIVMNRIKGRLT
jgi:heme/copper-type cytochrome/quinol oxidase subunit 1